MNERDYGTAPILKLFFRCTVPAMVGMGFSAIYNITDGIFVGHFIGQEALAAVNLVMPVLMIITALADMVAAAELERCVKELGMVGVLLTGQYNGRFYDEPEFFPIFEKAAELDIPVYWHPEFVNSDIIDYYYMSDSYSAIVGAELGSAGFGWHIDVGIHVARMVLSGIFDKIPNLKFVTGHWGEDIPAFLERMDYMLNQETTGLQKKVSDYYKENIWYTPSGIMSELQLDYFVKLFGAEHIIWSEDYPYIQNEPLRFFLDKADLTADQKYAIARGNAEKIFKLK